MSLRLFFSRRLREFILKLLFPYLLDVIYRSLLKRKIDPEESIEYRQKNSADLDIEGVISSIIKSDDFLTRFVKDNAATLLRPWERVLLDPDRSAQVIPTAIRQLEMSGDLAQVTEQISASSSHWRYIVSSRAEVLVKEMCDALLGTGCEAAVGSAAADLRNSGRLDRTLAAFVESEAHWRELLRRRARTVIAEISQALLGLNNSEGTDAAISGLADSGDLCAAITAIAQTREFERLFWREQAGGILNAVYEAVLRRTPDIEGRAFYEPQLLNSQGLEKVLSSIIASEEFGNVARTRASKGPPRVPLVFLHMQKTAGTSLQNMLKERFGDAALCEHDDTLSVRSPEELARLSVVAGHFNFDSIEYIPQRPLNIVTLARDPKARLISVYRFWKSHGPSTPGWHEGMQLAHGCDMETFFSSPAMKARWDIWNHMTWAIMGHRYWTSLRDLNLLEPASRDDHCLINFRADVMKRLADFTFIGLQSDFKKSMELMCRFTGLDPFEDLRHDHSISELAKLSPYIRELGTHEPITPAIDCLLGECTKFDSVIFEEINRVYEKYGSTLTPAEFS